MFTEKEVSCQRKKYFVKGGNFVSNATIKREFELKFPVRHVRCQKFPVGNTHTPTGKMTPWGSVRGEDTDFPSFTLKIFETRRGGGSKKFTLPCS